RYGPRDCDIVVVGGGIVGCATARELLSRYPHLKIILVEKENELAAHQSGHNSGVVHAGIYYLPGTLKAKLCVKGLELSYKYFDQNNIPYKKCGKLIVATEKHELAALDTLFQRGLANGVKDMKIIEGVDIPKIEPHCRGIRAIWSPHTGIVDWCLVTKTYAKNFKDAGGHVLIDHKVNNFFLNSPNSNNETFLPLSLRFTDQVDIRCHYAVTCAGLYSDHVAQLSACSEIPKIVPFRGEYLLLKPEKRNLIKGNIYPVPDLKFPFLGVHFTPRMNGDVWLGPNAILAFKREGYKFWDFDYNEFVESITFRGMQKLMFKYARMGMKEMLRSFSMSAEVRQLQRFVPELTVDDVERGPAGVRAQALDQNGSLVDDFVFDSGKGDLAERVLHVRNAPSPAATSSLAIAEMVVDKAVESFQLQKL
uniref:L-2-hydroxyglutarate dehydrogenase, mitochondrial n=1 Tax=Romanomermis culicivorax TaxID=13658 RepID=A0A915KL82_ROMCU